MRIVLTTLLLVSFIEAQSIKSLIQESLKKHSSLQTIKHRLSAMDEEIAKSRKGQNPDLSVSINNIQFGDISNRSLEPMQYEALNVAQKFPWFGKIDARVAGQQIKIVTMCHAICTEGKPITPKRFACGWF
jgi:outer membrane protein TolC